MRPNKVGVRSFGVVCVPLVWFGWFLVASPPGVCCVPVDSTRLDSSRADAKSISHSIERSGDSIRQRRTRTTTTTTTTTTTMAIGDSKEDLSAFSREDLVYKAKLAEQAERYATRTMRCDARAM